MKKISTKLLSINKKQFIIYSFLLSLSITLTTNILTNLFVAEDLKIKNDLMEQHISIIFLFIVLISPFFETLIFQFSIIELGYKFIKKEKIVLFTSAFLFGFVHIFNNEAIINKVIYFTITFLSGLIWAIIYSLAKKRKNVSPFLLILSIHIFENLIGFVINELI